MMVYAAVKLFYLSKWLMMPPLDISVGIGTHGSKWFNIEHSTPLNFTKEGQVFKLFFQCQINSHSEELIMLTCNQYLLLFYSLHKATWKVGK